MTTTRRALAVGTILLGLVAAAAAAAPKHQYVLKHPKREHCKAHYVKTVKKVGVRRRGRIVKVRKTFCVYKNGYVLKHPKRERCKAHYEKKMKKVRVRRGRKVVKVRKTFCVWVAPQKAGTPVQPTTPPAPQPTPPAPQPTTTTLTVQHHGCEFLSYGGIATVQICEYLLVVSVADSAGVSIPSPTTTLVFTNAAKPGESWTIAGAAEVGIFTHEECVGECVASLFEAQLNALGEVRKIPIASVPEGGFWSAVAA